MKNLIVYAWEGFKKLFVSTPKLNDILEHVHHGESDNEQDKKREEEEEEKQNEILVLEGKSSSDKSINSQKSLELTTTHNFRLFPSIANVPENFSATSKVSVLRGDHAVFLCSNIPSYMGGSSPWKNSKGAMTLYS